MGPLQHCSRLCVCMCVCSPAPTLPMGQAHTTRMSPPSPTVAMETHLEQAPPERCIFLLLPSTALFFATLLLSPNASVALPLSIPSSRTPSLSLQSSFLSLFLSLHLFLLLPLPYCPSHQLPGLVYGLYYARDDTLTFCCSFTCTRTNSHSLGMEGVDRSREVQEWGVGTQGTPSSLYGDEERKSGCDVEACVGQTPK